MRRTASLADVGLSEELFVRLVDVIREGTYANVHGVVVVKDDRLVFEEYFAGKAFEAAIGNRIVGPQKAFDRDIPHNLASVTKTITSTILGVAIDQGFVSGVDTAVYDFFPEHADLLMEPWAPASRPHIKSAKFWVEGHSCSLDS